MIMHAAYTYYNAYTQLNILGKLFTQLSRVERRLEKLDNYVTFRLLLLWRIIRGYLRRELCYSFNIRPIIYLSSELL